MQVRYRSLYWRIGIGFIVCIAAVLAIQGGVMLWLTSRPDADARTTFTLALARQIGDALTRDPGTNVDALVRSAYPTPPRSFYVMLVSGDAYFYGNRRPTPAATETVQEEFQHESLTKIPRLWELSPYWSAPIVVNGIVKGAVAVVPRSTVRDLWPQMALLAFGLLVVGTALASRFIFGPAHRRLMALERSAQLFGAGNATARADEQGGDEVASLARTFNVMASDLSARAAEISDLDRTRRLLLADISHELMTPLTAILGYQEKLSTDPSISSSHQRRRYVGIIGEEAQRVQRIVSDLLDLARFEGGGNVLDIQDVSIEGLFGRVAARQDAAASARGVQVVTTIEPGAEIVRGDQFRLEQALQNLAANALRHVQTGDAIELHAALVGRDIVITVRDTGIGIAAEHLPFIFDRFYKIDSSRTAVLEGSGLGLSIVKAIVERHGGRIAVTSEPGVDTRFTIRLPSTADAVILSRSA